MSFLSNFYYQITGPEHGPKLVFLHGVMGFAANWRTVAKAFEDRFQILVFDQRGHGRSFQPPTGYAPEDYANDLKAILDELGWQQISLVGHSMGGRNATCFAFRFPECVTRLVIEDVGPGLDQRGADHLLKLIEAIPVPFADKRAAKEFFEGRFMELFGHVPQAKGLAQFLHANIVEDPQKRAVWRFSRQGVEESIRIGRSETRWNEVEGLRMPTLVIRGESSTYLPREIYSEMLKANPLIHGVEIPGAGHWVHSDQPQRFIAELARFLG